MCPDKYLLRSAIYIYIVRAGGPFVVVPIDFDFVGFCLLIINYLFLLSIIITFSSGIFFDLYYSTIEKWSFINDMLFIIFAFK